ncbi:MAG TPA: lysylphosphatidylglycerol synthase domain-containing protein [Actinomycetota bacterium]|nr:lysylphosphatidylglycerol synthase domain-containing protein [Actinomycetota bacterium]
MKRRSLAGLLPVLLVAGGVAGLVVRERTAFARAIDLMADSPSVLWLAAFAALIAGRGVLAGCSFAVAEAHLARSPARASIFAWLRSAITKYVPGVVWFPLTAVDRLRRAGIDARAAALGFYVDAVGSIVAAVIVGAIAVPALVSDGVATAWWLLLGIPAVLSLHPRLFAMGIAVIGRLTSRRMDGVALRWPTVANVVGLHVGSWIAAGFSLQLVFHALGSNVSWPLIFAATSISWAIGLLAIPVPAGLGIREAVLVTLLVAEIPTSTAVAAALASRALFVALDALSLGASFVLRQPDTR